MGGELAVRIYGSGGGVIPVPGPRRERARIIQTRREVEVSEEVVPAVDIAHPRYLKFGSIASELAVGHMRSLVAK